MHYDSCGGHSTHLDKTVRIQFPKMGEYLDQKYYWGKNLNKLVRINFVFVSLQSYWLGDWRVCALGWPLWKQTRWARSSMQQGTAYVLSVPEDPCLIYFTIRLPQLIILLSLAPLKPHADLIFLETGNFPWLAHFISFSPLCQEFPLLFLP